MKRIREVFRLECSLRQDDPKHNPHGQYLKTQGDVDKRVKLGASIQFVKDEWFDSHITVDLFSKETGRYIRGKNFTNDRIESLTCELLVELRKIGAFDDE